jgi:hypothetical protein
MNRTRSLILCSFLGAIFALTVFMVPGCTTNQKPVANKTATPIPAAPDSGKVVGDHQNRERVQGDATDKIDQTVTGTAVEAPVKEQTAIINDANQAASAEQIAKMAADFAVTLSAQSTEIKRLGSENNRISAENAEFVKKNGELQSKLDDFGRKVAVYTANGIGALLLLVAVAVGILTKNLQYVGWCLLGSLGGFGAARIIGHWIFPWVIGVSVLIVAGGFTLSHMAQRRKQAEKDRLLKAADDVIQGVEEVRGLFKEPPAEMAEIVRNADTPEKAIEAVRRLGAYVNKTLSAWVTDYDGTADVIKARRRTLGLTS